MKKWIAILALAALLAAVALPSTSFTEDRDTVLLARAIYALAKEEGYDTKLAVGTVAMNRVANAWFDDTLSGVLNAQHQFPLGRRYDADSLAAAHEVVAGRRTLPEDALYFRPQDAAEPWTEAPLKTVGGFAFYAADGNL